MSSNIENLISRYGGLRVLDYLSNNLFYDGNTVFNGGADYYNILKEDANKVTKTSLISEIYEEVFKKLKEKLRNKNLKLDDTQEAQIDELIELAKKSETFIRSDLGNLMNNKDLFIGFKKIYDIAERDKLGNDYLNNYGKINNYKNNNFDRTNEDKLFTEVLRLLHESLLEVYDLDSYPPFISEDLITSQKVVNYNSKYISGELNNFMDKYKMSSVYNS